MGDAPAGRKSSSPRRSFDGRSRYRVAISRERAVAMSATTAKGYRGAFGVSGGPGQGPGSFGFDLRADKIVYADVTMAQARRLHRDRLLAYGAGGMTFASERHPRKAAYAYDAPGIVVDLTDMERLAKGFIGIYTRLTKGRLVISRAINHGLMKLRTGLRRDVSQWTGLKAQRKIHQSFKILPAKPEFLVGVLSVQSGHTTITREYYGATWSRRNPGATHAAWNKPQLAVRTFMLPGRKPVFRRVKPTDKSRKKVMPIWGPNLAREVERHQAEVQAKVTAAGAVVAREAARLMAVEIARAR